MLLVHRIQNYLHRYFMLMLMQDSVPLLWIIFLLYCICPFLLAQTPLKANRHNKSYQVIWTAEAGQCNIYVI
jgi:hypothetical protein